MNFFEQMQETLKVSNLTKVALLADVSVPTVQKLKQGKKTVSFANVEKVCEVLGVKIN